MIEPRPTDRTDLEPDEKGRPVHGRNAKGEPVCFGRKNDGGRCMSRARRRNGRCRKHAGNTPRGVASPHFKTGEWSSSMPSRLVETYHRSLEDPEILALNTSIALTRARLGDLLSRVDTGDSDRWRRELKAAWDEFRAARSRAGRTGGSEDAKEARRQRLEDAEENLDRLVSACVADAAAWSELRAAEEHLRKLVETETKRRLSGAEVLMAEDAMALAAAVVAAARETVTDRRQLAAFAARLEDIMVGGGS